MNDLGVKYQVQGHWEPIPRSNEVVQGQVKLIVQNVPPAESHRVRCGALNVSSAYDNVSCIGCDGWFVGWWVAGWFVG